MAASASRLGLGLGLGLDGGLRIPTHTVPKDKGVCGDEVRLQPQMPVFFVALPMQIMISLVIMSLVLPAILLWFIDRFEASLNFFFVSN